MDKPPKYLSEFGPFRLDAANRLLFRDGEIVPLKPKVFDTLLVLVERSGQVVSKAELMERIWPDTIVEENNLTHNISVLRKVMGKDATGQDYIKTIPRRGYCFTSSIHEVWEENTDLIVEKSSRARIVIEEEQSDQPGKQSEAAIATEVLSRPSASIRGAVQRYAKRIIAAISVLVIALIMVWVTRHTIFPLPVNRNGPGPIVQITNWKSGPRETGARNGAFSPDGKKIVFSSNKNEHSGIWIKQLDGGESIEIVGDDSDWYNESPIWSPDEQRIAFVSNRGGHPGIWSVPSLGGTPTMLVAFQEGWPELKRWSKNASIFYEWEGNLFSLDLGSRQTVPMTDFDKANPSPSNFSLSPGEDRIAYAYGRSGHRAIWIKPLHGGEPVQVSSDRDDNQQPIWHPRDNTIIYSSQINGLYKICVAYLDGDLPTPVTSGVSNDFCSDISPDGSKILFIQSREEGDIYKTEVSTGEEIAITSDLTVELWPDISPDGKTIAFQTVNERVDIFHGAIVTKPAATSGQRIQLAVDGFDAQWSPSGNSLGFLRSSNDLYNIWTVKATGEQQRQLTTDGIIFYGFSGLPYNRKQTKDYSWSPGGSKIAYCSSKSGQMNVWVIDVNSSSEKMISDNTDPEMALLCPLWSPDGSRIAYTTMSIASAAEGRRTRSVRITEPGKPDIVFQSDNILHLIGWSESGNDLLVATIKDINKFNSTTAQIDLLQVSGSDGSYRYIATLDSAYLTNIALSTDRRSVAYVSRLNGRDNIWVIPSSGGRAKKITGNTNSREYFSSLVWSPDGRAIYWTRQTCGVIISTVDYFTGKDLVSWQRPPEQAAK